MLRFAQKPDAAFTAIVGNALEYALGLMTEEGAENCGLHSDIAEWFGVERLIKATENLIEAHRSEKIYMPTGYHFFILNEFISLSVELHNEVASEKGSGMVGKGFEMSCIDYDTILELFFWDDDFKMRPQVYDLLPRTMKNNQWGVHEETFGIANRFMPSDEDLELKESDQISQGLDYYVKGEDYPNPYAEWETVWQDIQDQQNPKVLLTDFYMRDNFSLLLNVNPSQKALLEAMLDRYPKEDGFEENLKCFGCKGYVVGNTHIRYKPKRCERGIEIFEERTGTSPETNASISFHPIDGESGAQQALFVRDAVVDITGKIIEFCIPFVTARPVSRHRTYL